jgi:hypothetical protein
MSPVAKQTRTNRTITVDFRDEATYVQLLGDGKTFVECVCAFLLALGFQLAHKATCRLPKEPEGTPGHFYRLRLAHFHAPADPHRALTPMKRLFQQGTVFHHPALDGRVVDRYAALLHEFFHMPVAQGIGHVHRTPIRMMSFGKWAPLKLIAIIVLPRCLPWITGGDHTSKGRE